MEQRSGSVSFGDLLRYFRGQTVDKRNGKPLSQEKLADLLYQKTGLEISRNNVYDWESSKRYLNAHYDRSLLIAIIAILHEHQGITTFAQANQLLEAGNFRALNLEEAEEIDSTWASDSTGEEEETLAAEPSFAAETLRRVDGNSSLTISVEASKPLPVTFQAQNSRPGSAPPAPALLVGRDDDLRVIKANLGIFAAPADPSVGRLQIITAIKGWPGVGKTSVASALAHDLDIQRAFPDGVLWVSLGQEPDLLTLLTRWFQALGYTDPRQLASLEEARDELVALLRSKRMLLIIDDVWQAEHAVPFLVGGSECATLVTTRRDDVANALAPASKNIYRLKVLQDEKAFELLRDLAPAVVAEYPQECAILVHKLEGLPLALQVAGRLLNTEANRGFGIKELIEDLQTGATLLEAPAPADRINLVTETTPSIAALLKKSLDLLDRKTRVGYAYLGAFAPSPATFDLKAVRDIWQVEDPRPIIGTLVDRGLLEYLPSQDRYRMHALLVMLAKSLYADRNQVFKTGFTSVTSFQPC